MQASGGALEGAGVDDINIEALFQELKAFCDEAEAEPVSEDPPKEPSPDAARLIAEAHVLAARGETGAAAAALQESLRLSPRAPPAYDALASLLAPSAPHRALCFGLCGALLGRAPAATWRRLGEAALGVGAFQEALLCCQRVLVAEPGDLQALWECAHAYRGLGELGAEAEALGALLAAWPGNAEVAGRLAQTRVLQGLPGAAAEGLLAFVEQQPGAVTGTLVNSLALLLHHRLGAYADVLRLLDTTEPLLAAAAAAEGTPFVRPPDLAAARRRSV